MGEVNKGFTLIELLVTTAVLIIFLTAATVIVQTGIESLGEARLRGEATRLAQEQLELVRNMTYEDVGTVGGIPAGPLAPSDTVELHGTQFSINTEVVYVDDPFDDLAPIDFLPVDYKRVRVEVTWGGMFPSRKPVVLLTDVSPAGIETAEDEGMLSVLVFDAEGHPVSSATVTIQADSLTPAVDMEILTDVDGKVLIPGAPICDSCYRIGVTKEGYTSDRTYSNAEVDNPYKQDLSVLENQISEVSFAIDQPASLTIKATRDQSSNYQPFVGVQFRLHGTKIIGTTASGDDVYKVDRTVVTSTGGLTTATDLDWDQYVIEMPPLSSVDMAGSWPFMPVSLLPNNSQQVIVVVQAASTNSLLVQALNESRLPLDSFVSTLFLGDQPVATKSSGAVNQGNWSQTYFSTLSTELYSLTIEADGYATASADIDISGDVVEGFILSTSSAEEAL